VWRKLRCGGKGRVGKEKENMNLSSKEKDILGRLWRAADNAALEGRVAHADPYDLRYALNLLWEMNDVLGYLAYLASQGAGSFDELVEELKPTGKV
jgi:hypothetical protein